MEAPYPFHKNRYFPRKRLRAADFVRDQAFFDRKLGFLSHWLFGRGKAFGLGVRCVDSDSLLVEPGFAVDALGRWLIVDEPTVCRVRALDGFGQLSGETAVLRIAYREEEFDPVMLDAGEERCAAARERFSFSLAEWQAEMPCEAEKALFSDRLLFEDMELRVTQRLPRVLSAGGQTDALLIFESSAPGPLEAALAYAPRVSGFAGSSGGTPVCVRQQLRLAPGETVVHVPLFPVSAGQAAVFSLETGGFQLEKRGSLCALQEAVRLELPVVREPVQALAERLSELSPQELWMPAGEGIPLAGVRLIRGGEQCLLDGVFPIGADARIPLPYLQEHLRGCLACFPEPEIQPLPPAPPVPVPQPPEPRRPARSASGVAQLSLGLHARKGDILRTGELVHGLGPGTVFLDFGLEEVQPGPGRSGHHSSLLFGDVSLFEDGGEECFDCAARVFPERGTFELAVRLRGEPRRAMLRLRWFAWQAEEEAPPAPSGKVGRLVRLNPDVVTVRPGETIGFTAVFEGGESAPCKFSVIDRHGGSITRDGIYTAPDQAGLYQVQAQACGAQEQQAHAFVLVKEAADGSV